MRKNKFSNRLKSVIDPVSQNLMAKVRVMRDEGIEIHDFAKQADPPEMAIKDAINELNMPKGSLYSDTRGAIKLRKAIAKRCFLNNGLEINPETDIVVTVGAKEAILSTLLALVDIGDEVLVEDPGYISFEPLIRLVGGVPVRIPLEKKNGFKFPVETFERKITKKTSLLLLCNPHNPTGRCLSTEELSKISEISIATGIYVLVDEAYEHFVYDDKTHISLASFPGMYSRTVTVQTISKIFNMGGWRIGWAYGSYEIVEKMLLAHTHVVTCPATFAQAGAAVVIENNIGEGNKPIKAIVERYQLQRDFIVNQLQSMLGVKCHKPAGTFFVFPNISSFGQSSGELSEYLLEEARVSSVPGDAFGPNGDGYLRMVFKSDIASIKKGMEAMSKALEKLAIMPKIAVSETDSK